MRRAALRSALSVKAAEKEIVILDVLALPEIKTQLMVQALDRLVGDASALILYHEKNDETQKVYLSTRNLPDAKALLASYINIRDLMTFDRLILPLSALDLLVSVLK